MAMVCMVVTNRGYDDPRVCMEAEALAQRGYGVTTIGWDRDRSADMERCQNGVRFLGMSVRSTHGRAIEISARRCVEQKYTWPARMAPLIELCRLVADSQPPLGTGTTGVRPGGLCESACERG